MKQPHALTVSALLLLTPLTTRAQVLPRVVDVGKSEDADKAYRAKVAEQVEQGYQAQRAGDYLNAARLLQTALRMGPEKPDEVQAALVEAKKQIGTLKLQISELDARLSLDGELVAFWPTFHGGELYVTPGMHRLKATKDEYVTWEKVIDVAVGEERVISIALVQEGYELYRKILGIPTQVQMSMEAKMGAQPEPPTWPTKVMIGGIVGFVVGTSLCVTGALMPENDGVWRGVAIGGGVFGVLSLGVVGIGAVGWATRPSQPPIIQVQPVITNQQTGASVSGQW